METRELRPHPVRVDVDRGLLGNLRHFRVYSNSLHIFLNLKKYFTLFWLKREIEREGGDRGREEKRHLQDGFTIYEPFLL